MLCRYCSVFYKLKVSGYSALRSFGVIFPTVFAYFVLHLVILAVFQTLIICYGDQWSLMLLLQERYNLLKAHLVISTI